MSANARVKLQYHDHARLIERNPTLRLKHSTLANKNVFYFMLTIFYHFFFPFQIPTKSKTVGEDNPLPLESSTALAHKTPSVFSVLLGFYFWFVLGGLVICLKKIKHKNQSFPNGLTPAQEVLPTPLVSGLSYTDITI